MRHSQPGNYPPAPPPHPPPSKKVWDNPSLSLGSLHSERNCDSSTCQGRYIFWVLKRPLWFLNGSGFHFWTQIVFCCPMHVPRAEPRKWEVWRAPYVAGDSATLSSQWLCWRVVLSASGKQIHKKQIAAFFNLVDSLGLFSSLLTNAGAPPYVVFGTTFFRLYSSGILMRSAQRI